MGIEVNLGYVYDSDTPLDSGVYFGAARSQGANVGVGAGLGYFCRDIEGEGAALDVNGGPIPVSVSPQLDDKGLNGATLTYGPGVGISGSTGKTWTLSINSILRTLQGRGK